jgi:DNA-binding beta-propeller fold protein YncE
VALSRDERVVLVSLLSAGRVALIDAETLKTRALVETGGRPRLMAADPAGRGVLVANENGWLDLVT